MLKDAGNEPSAFLKSQRSIAARAATVRQMLPAGQKIKAVTLAEQSLKRKLAYTFLQSRAGYLDPAITPNLIESNRAVERVSIGNCVYKLEVVFKAHCAAPESSADGASVKRIDTYFVIRTRALSSRNRTERKRDFKPGFRPMTETVQVR